MVESSLNQARLMIETNLFQDEGYGDRADKS